MPQPVLTTEAVRVALGMQQLKAEYASRNIANAATPGWKPLAPDFARAESLLLEAARAGDGAHGVAAELAAFDSADVQVTEARDGVAVQLDAEVADMVGAQLSYQALGQSLSRYFGLMRLAATGRF